MESTGRHLEEIEITDAMVSAGSDAVPSHLKGLLDCDEEVELILLAALSAIGLRCKRVSQ